MSAQIASVLRRGFDEFRDFVNPLITQRAELAGEPIRLVRTEGGRLIDQDGRPIEDFHGTQAFGHRNPTITQAIKDFLDSDSPSWFPSRVNPYAGRLAKTLCTRANHGAAEPYSNAFFVNSGSEAVEAALKLSRAVTKRPRILSIDRAYHGCTFGSCALMSRGVFRDPFAPHLPGVEALPHNDLDALSRAFAEGDIAAVVVEPIQLEGGVRHLSAAYIEALCELTARHGALLVADEVQTGLGRTGRFLCSESWPRRPDAVLLAKHLGGGLMPISCMLTRRDLYERAYGANFETAEAHNCTFSGNALACVAALAALDLLSDETISRVRSEGEWFRASLREALGASPLLADIRGDGLVAGIVLTPESHPWISFDHFGIGDLAHHPTVGLLLCHRLYKRGFFCFVCGHDWSVLRLQPRFDIPRETLAQFVTVAREELEALSELAA